jgi:hypothetical protein
MNRRMRLAGFEPATRGFEDERWLGQTCGFKGTARQHVRQSANRLGEAERSGVLATDEAHSQVSPRTRDEASSLYRHMTRWYFDAGQRHAPYGHDEVALP